MAQVSAHWWRKFPDSPTGPPTLAIELQLAKDVLRELQLYRNMTLYSSERIKVQDLTESHPSIKCHPLSWVCQVIDEHLGREYQIDEQGIWICAVANPVQRDDSRPPLTRRHTIGEPPLKWRHTQHSPRQVKRKYELLARSGEEEEEPIEWKIRKPKYSG